MEQFPRDHIVLQTSLTLSIYDPPFHTGCLHEQLQIQPYIQMRSMSTAQVERFLNKSPAEDMKK